MKDRTNIILFALVVFMIPFSAFAFIHWYENKIQRLKVYSEPGHRIESFQLLDQDSFRVTEKLMDKKVTVADFFFTHCPTICPAMQKNMKRVQQSFKNMETLQLVSFSVDPDHDLPSVLLQYSRLRNIDSTNWIFITGDKKTIYKLARNSFKVVATDGDGGSDDFIHSEKLVLLDKQQRIRGYYDGTSDKETDQLITDIKKLFNEK